MITDGGTESLGVTAGETRNPTRNMPRVVKAVFWRSVMLSNATRGLIPAQNTDILPSNYSSNWIEWFVV